MATAIILIALAVIVVFAFRSSKKHVSGEGGCCGGGGGTIAEDKKLEGEAIGSRTVKIEGMHCENCKNRVEREVNRIDGAVCKVNLRKNQAVVSFDREVSDEDIKNAIEIAGYEVKSIS